MDCSRQGRAFTLAFTLAPLGACIRHRTRSSSYLAHARSSLRLPKPPAQGSRMPRGLLACLLTLSGTAALAVSGTAKLLVPDATVCMIHSRFTPTSPARISPGTK